MAPWIAMLAMSVAQKQQQQKEEEQARREAMSNVSAQQAAQLGYPSQRVGAAQFNRQMAQQNQGQNWMASLLPMLMQQGGTKGQQPMPQQQQPQTLDPWAR